MEKVLDWPAPGAQQANGGDQIFGPEMNGMWPLRSEVRGQKSEVRGQRSEVRGQRSEVSGQKSRKLKR